MKMFEKLVIKTENANQNANKKITAITLILIMTLSALLAGVQISAAQTAQQYPSFAYIVAIPNPVGLGQTGFVNFWIADPLRTIASTYGQLRTGLTVTITKPDGTTEKRGPFTANYEGGAYFDYAPTMIGNYTFKLDYPQEKIYLDWNYTTNQPPPGANYYIAQAATASYTLTVRQEKVQEVYQVPYPSEFWKRPIEAENYWWQTISGNWLMGGWNISRTSFDSGSTFVGEGTLPNTAHVLWTKPMTFGGLAGGIYGNVEYYSGMSYEMYFKPPIIIGGRIYYDSITGGEPTRGLGGGPPGTGELGNVGTEVVDMYTGKTLFTIPNATMAFGQIFNFAGPDQSGTHAYLWSTAGTTWTMFDAWTGNKIAVVANVTSGTVAFGPQGEVIVYGLSYKNNFLGQNQGSYILTKWNSTKLFNAYQPGPETGAVGTTTTGVTQRDLSWRPYFAYGQVLDGNKGIQWQVAALNASGYSQPDLKGAPAGAMLTSKASPLDYNLTGSDGSIAYVAYSMDDGRQLWTSTLKPTSQLPFIPDARYGGLGTVKQLFNGNFYGFNHYTLQWASYDIKSGQLKWITDPYTVPYGYFAQAGGFLEAYGNYIVAGFDGYVHAYNISTGKESWNFTLGSSGLLTPFGHHTFYNGITIADGKIFLTPNEHGNGVEPLFQNLTTTVIDARTGDLLWSIVGYFEQPAFSDGILFSHNNYDNQIYAFGKGPTHLTVSAPDIVLAQGSGVMIRGSVMDISTGANQEEQAMRFPDGVPAVSDISMKSWMEYVYMQKARPENVKGVDVKITVVDSNNNVQEFTTTSDSMGQFSIVYTPEISGKYTVVAQFAGSESYWPSSAETAFGIAKAPSPLATGTPSQEPTPPQTASPTLLPSPAPNPTGNTSFETYAIIAAVVIIAIVMAAALVLKKRK